MKSSPVFDEIRADGMREIVCRLGRQKFGKAPTKTQQKTLEAISELDRLATLAERLLNVDSWADLLSEV